MQNLYKEFYELISGDNRLVSEGKLMKNKVVELALNLDYSLLKHLLKSDSLKKHFFGEVEGVLIFDKIKFQKFVSNKEFLPGSFTAFKNKIGLVADDEYLNVSKKVVLAWPYKDCVLEGGQDREDAARNEIFWNEVLAPDEIDRLLSPKVLTGFKKYSKQGVSDVSSLSGSENLIIKGNNLLGLETLLLKFEKRIDLIYIDPPFNTENDSFKYNDKFCRSTWLSFMRNRLELARKLLKPSGTFYVHVDHNEGHYLKVLMDEIFGESNFRNEIIWHYSGWNKKLTNSFERRHDTIFMYGNGGQQFFNSYFEKWKSKEAYIKKRKQKLLMDEDGREYLLSDAGGSKRVKMYVEDVLKSGVVVDDVWHLDKLNNSAKESVGFQTQKTEELIQRFISASCPTDGIVLDFHLGSGTTAAVAHKMGIRYIGIEQLDYINSTTINRLQEVIAGDQNGISKEVKWSGGGEFVYCELAKANQVFVDAIQSAKSAEELLAIWNMMQDKAFLSYRVNPKAFDESKSEFVELSLADQKKFLIETLDKNMLYVPLSEIDDATYEISDADKALNKKFFA